MIILCTGLALLFATAFRTAHGTGGKVSSTIDRDDIIALQIRIGL
jgi:hypothetical protein